MADEERLENRRVTHVSALLPPSCVVEELPGDDQIYTLVIDTREQLLSILAGTNDRLLVVVQSNGTREELLKLAQEVSKLSSTTRENLLLILEPHEISDSDVSINQALRLSRALLLQVNREGVPTAYNFGDTVTPQYMADLLSWASVSAQSEMLRELVSGLSMPAGLRATVADAPSALNALELCANGHHFLGISSEGLAGIVSSTGNTDAHVVLEASLPRGADAATLIEQACTQAKASAHGSALMIDVSTGDGADALNALSGAITGRLAIGGIAGVRVRVEAMEQWGLGQTMLLALAQAVKTRRSAKFKQVPSVRHNERSDNLRIQGVRPLLPPACLLEEQPRQAAHEAVVRRARAELHRVLNGESDKLLVLVGPSLVDDQAACMEFAARLSVLAAEVQQELLVVMRVQLMAEAGASWPGIVKDPTSDGAFHINKGLRLARELLLQVNQLGLPTASDFMDTVTPQYFADLLSFASVNAQSEMLRELVSGLSMPVGLRSTPAQLADALAAQEKAAVAQQFFGVTSHGIAGIVHATGNEDCGLFFVPSGASASERAAATVAAAKAHPKANLVVDCGGAGFACTAQAELAAKLSALVAEGDQQLRGVCLSSYLLSGAKAEGAASAVRGMSVASPCMDWMQTEESIRALAAAVRKGRIADGAPAGKKQRLNGK